MTESNNNFIQVEKMSIDQLAGAFVMIAGAVGSLLLVIWQSKCHCRMNLCYIFSCERRPPNEEEMKSLKDQAEKLKGKDKPEVSVAKKDEKLIPSPTEGAGAKLERKDSMMITEEETTKDNDMPSKQESSYP